MGGTKQGRRRAIKYAEISRERAVYVPAGLRYARGGMHGVQCSARGRRPPPEGAVLCAAVDDDEDDDGMACT